MSNLDDLGIKSITSMTVDEGLEHIRLLRLARRTGAKAAKAAPKPASNKKPKSPDIGSMSDADREELLKLLTGE
jgi:hypothetical protein